MMLLVGVVVVSLVAQAESVVVGAPSTPTALVSDVGQSRDRVRLRAGFGIGGGSESLGSASRQWFVAFGVGFSGDLGVQLTDRFAVYARASVSTLLLTGYATTELLAEFGNDWVSVSAGAGVTGDYFVVPMAFSASSAAAVVPVILAISPFGRAATEVERQGFQVTIEGDIALPWNAANAWHPGYGASVHLGYAWR